MKSAVLLVLPILAAWPDPPEFPIVETFASTQASQRWHPMTGDWKFTDHRALQTDAAYDHGAGIGVRPAGPFWLSVRFRPESAFVGGGLFFGLPRVNRRNGGMMVRCDPEVILWGRMNAAGVFDFGGNADVSSMPEGEQELAVAVDPAKAAFNVYHDGKRVATDIKADAVSGFVGIQSSGGPHRFTRVELRAARPEELAGLTPDNIYGRIIDLVANDAGVVALRRASDTIVRFDETGKVVQRLPRDRVAVPEGRDWDPVALSFSTGGTGDLLVLADSGNALYRFAPDFAPKDRIALDPVARGVALCTDAAGRIFIADAALPGIRVLDSSGKQRLAFGKRGSFDPNQHPGQKASGLFSEPAGICIDDAGRLYVSDRANLTYVAYRYDPAANTLTFDQHGPWMSRPGRIACAPDNRLALTGGLDFYGPYGALRLLGRDGRPQQAFAGYAVNMISPRSSLAIGPGRKDYVADPGKARIIVLPNRFTEPAPVFDWPTSNSARVRVGAVEATANVVPRPGATTARRVELVLPRSPFETWPPAPADQVRKYRFPAPPHPGFTYVIDMPVVVAVFCNATTEGKDKLSLPRDSIGTRLEREHARVRDFYFRNSHATLNLIFEHMVIDEVTADVKGGWIPPQQGRKLVNDVRKQRGLPVLAASDSLVTIFPMKGWDASATDDPGIVGGGGLTPFAYSGYGLWNRGIGWLMCHEWNHQLDAYFDASGVPEYWLNHPDATLHIGRYGQHWDCNAFLMRRLDRMNWLRLNFGKLREVADRDGDNLADDDPSLPMDEKRFGSDPSKKDTDGDGLDDLAEYTASTFRSSDPRSADSDADQLPDARDPYPCHAVNTAIPHDAPPPGDRPRDFFFAPIGVIDRDWCRATVTARHSENQFELGLAFDQPPDVVYADIDADNDGWFTGFDNIDSEVNMRRAGDGWEVAGARKCKASATHDPKWGYLLHLTIQLPAAARSGPRTIGMTLHVRKGEHHEAFLTDPWDILPLELK